MELNTEDIEWSHGSSSLGGAMGLNKPQMTSAKSMMDDLSNDTNCPSETIEAVLEEDTLTTAQKVWLLSKSVMVPSSKKSSIG